MTDAISPLPASCRTSDDDYPGVVAYLGADYRLAVSMDADRFSLHERLASGGWRPAGGNSPSTLERICAKYADQVEGLAALCASLPPYPDDAVPGFKDRRQAQLAALDVRNMTSANYGRVVAQETQLRLAVDPDGLGYWLQWTDEAGWDSPGARWKRLMDAQTLSEVWQFVVSRVFVPFTDGPKGRTAGDDLWPRWQAMVAGLPERADDGVWPDLPPLP